MKNNYNFKILLGIASLIACNLSYADGCDQDLKLKTKYNITVNMQGNPGNQKVFYEVINEESSPKVLQPATPIINNTFNYISNSYEDILNDNNQTPPDLKFKLIVYGSKYSTANGDYILALPIIFKLSANSLYAKCIDGSPPMNLYRAVSGSLISSIKTIDLSHQPGFSVTVTQSRSDLFSKNSPICYMIMGDSDLLCKNEDFSNIISVNINIPYTLANYISLSKATIVDLGKTYSWTIE